MVGGQVMGEQKLGTLVGYGAFNYQNARVTLSSTFKIVKPDI
jgi:hypothetical protein